ncbi:MAG: helix-turn-helix domain-containing protein [Gammaproteobacteria bacterium]|nr:helix-turn-helix domain-containing protein [Gammaproteobacteria bacterium]
MPFYSKKVCLYLRVSTTKQATDLQRLELEQIAASRQWNIVKIYEDQLSGANTDRPQLQALLKAATRKEFDLVACWSVDRLGRNLSNLCSIFQELASLNIELFFAKQAIDTSTPSGKMMLNLVGVFAEYERAMMRERISAGLQRAKANGRKVGRPSNTNDSTREAIVELFKKNMSRKQIAKTLRVGCGTVYKTLTARGLIQLN